jgi:hypothetical protein
MNEQRRALMAFSGIFLATRRASAVDPPAGDLLSRIARARAQVRTLQGPFTQTRRIGLLVSDVHSTGDLALTRPSWLRWRLLPPDDVTFWVGPEGLAYRSAHGQGRLAATSAGIAAALDDLCTLIGGDLTKLDGRWSLRVLHDGPGGVEVEASARDGSPALARTMTFGLTPDLTRPTHVLLVEGARDRTDIQFGDLGVNEPIDDAGMRPP